MKILKLRSSYELEPAKAILRSKPKSTKKQYCLPLGTRGEEYGLWQYTIFLDAKYFPPTESSELILDGSDYVLKPLKDNNTKLHVKDKKNNPIYFIDKDVTDVYRDDTLLVWEIPNKVYTDVKYEVKGDASVLGSGRSGRERNGVMYSSPVVLIEIIGDCVLSWSAVNKDGKKVSQVVRYNFVDNKWDVGSIEVGNLKEGE